MTTYSVAEVAAQIGASESFLRGLVKRREIPCLRLGRSAIRFTEAHVEAIIEHLTQPAGAPTPVASLTTTRSRARRSA